MMKGGGVGGEGGVREGGAIGGQDPQNIGIK